jgi:alpha-ketoglutarate-dependent taurine dioxygenase
MEIRELSPALGVLVSGLDPAAPIDPRDLEALRHAFRERHLLLVRAPELGDLEHVRFARLFGPVYDEYGDTLGYHFVSNVKSGAIIGHGPLLFHSDLAFTPEPTLGLSLYAVEVPDDGAPTRFANAVRALERLPAAVRAKLSGLHALHLYDLTHQYGDVRYREADLPAREPRAVHPVLLRDPRDGREILYVSQMQTDRILELAPDEGEALLQELFSALYAPDNVYEHRWRPGDLLIWDNLALQHGRNAPDLPRTLRRVTLAHKGTPDQVPWFPSPHRAARAPATGRAG